MEPSSFFSVHYTVGERCKNEQGFYYYYTFKCSDCEYTAQYTPGEFTPNGESTLTVLERGDPDARHTTVPWSPAYNDAARLMEEGRGLFDDDKYGSLPPKHLQGKCAVVPLPPMEDLPEDLIEQVEALLRRLDDETKNS